MDKHIWNVVVDLKMLEPGHWEGAMHQMLGAASEKLEKTPGDTQFFENLKIENIGMLYPRL